MAASRGKNSSTDKTIGYIRLKFSSQPKCNRPQSQMLQVTSGRFWDPGQRFDLQERELLYSVLSLDAEIIFSAGRLAPTKSENQGIRCTDFAYIRGLPIPADGLVPGLSLSIDGDEIEEQLVALLTIYTGRLWSRSPEKIAELSKSNQSSKASFPYLTTAGEVDHQALYLFLEKALALPRKQYKAMITATTTIYQAIQASSVSYDAAFAMAIFAIESLVPEGADTPDWSYMPTKTRKKLDDLLKETGELSHQVRSVLLEDRHFKLQAKFLKFSEEHISTEFHRSPIGIRRSDLRRVLRNAYSGRSKYAHKLTSVERPKFDIHESQSITWQLGEPHLTLQGAVLLASEIIRCYIRSAPHLDRENNVNWRSDLPGVVTVHAARQHWLWAPEIFQGKDFRELLCQIVEHAILIRLGAREPRIDFRPGLKLAIDRSGQLPKEDRLRLICMVVIWSWIAPSHKLLEGETFLEKYGSALEQPSPESLMLHVLGGWPIPWSLEKTQKQWEKYLENRYGIGKLRFFSLVESAIQGCIANQGLAAGDTELYENYCNHIADDAERRPQIIEHIQDSLHQKKPLCIQFLLEGVVQA